MIVVLGIDGLEYDLVEEFKLNSIKLKAYSKTNLEDFDVVVTPPIWASMLTGRIIDDMMKTYRLTTFKFAESKKAILRRMFPRWLIVFFGRLWGRIIFRIKGNPMNYTSNYLERNNYPTIFDKAINPIYNKIPGFNVTKKGKLLQIAFLGKDFKTFVEKKCLMEIEEARKNLLNFLEKDYDLIFWYTHALDTLGHIYYGRKIKTMGYYLRVSNLVSEIIKRLKEKDKFYIISDHGIKALGEGGLHSSHGFFSSNTGEIISKPQELYSLLKKNLQ